MFLAPHHWKKLFPVQLRTKLLFQLPEMVKNMPRTHKHTHTHTKKTQPCAAAPTSTGSFKRRSKLHVTTLRYAGYPLALRWQLSISSCFWSLSTFLLSLGSWQVPIRIRKGFSGGILHWYKGIQRSFGTWRKYVWNLLKSTSKHLASFNSASTQGFSFSLRIEPLYVQRVGPRWA